MAISTDFSLVFQNTFKTKHMKTKKIIIIPIDDVHADIFPSDRQLLDFIFKTVNVRMVSNVIPSPGHVLSQCAHIVAQRVHQRLLLLQNELNFLRENV